MLRATFLIAVFFYRVLAAAETLPVQRPNPQPLSECTAEEKQRIEPLRHMLNYCQTDVCLLEGPNDPTECPLHHKVLAEEQSLCANGIFGASLSVLNARKWINCHDERDNRTYETYAIRDRASAVIRARSALVLLNSTRQATELF
jgi:hypothetical protein